MLEHGGDLNAVARQYSIAVDDWLDLSTGITPNGWPVPDTFESSLWSRLPQSDDGLLPNAQHYYQSDALLATAGSQAVIQTLPYCRKPCRVGIISPAYNEHQYAWQQTGHEIVTLNVDTIEPQLDKLDVLIIINPNNPTGHFFSVQQLKKWHQQLAYRGGWLIVDEAFIDVTPEYSLTPYCPQQGLIVLRSLGKFFGLAGLRVGFVFAEIALLAQLEERLGPWPIATVSRHLAQRALADSTWQKMTRRSLAQSGQRLADLLAANNLNTTGCALFQWGKHDAAESLHIQLAKQGIYTRLFKKPQSLRFGLPKTERDWQRLERALQGLSA
jgi:cobalamin biosynthetic protein CobC